MVPRRIRADVLRKDVTFPALARWTNTLRKVGRRLMAETRGNLLGLLSTDDARWETLVPEEGLEPPRA